MVGRPRLPLGTAGDISFDQTSSGFRARTRVRDYDGRTRQLVRTGKTKGAAKAALSAAIRDRYVGVATDVTPETTVEATCEAWWKSFTQKQRSPGTLRNYRDRLDRQIIPALGGLSIRELTTGTVDRHIQAVATKHGPGLAKTTRSVLSNVCAFAAQQDALDRNVVRDAGQIEQSKKERAWDAFTLKEALDIRLKVGLDDQAVERDIPDLIDMLLATGLRIGEVCAIEWPSVNLEAGTVDVGGGMVVYERGKGVYIRHDPSNKLKKRVLELPEWAVTMLRLRKPKATSDLVFPSAKGKLRDPSNTSKHVAAALTKAGYKGATAHVFRRTVATWMDESGLSARAAADQLGHSKVNMTQNSYYARHRGSTGAKQVLDKMIITLPEEPV